MVSMQSLLILGRQPGLGLAELESLYGADKLTPVGSQSVIVDVDSSSLDYDRLGGSLKLCKVLETLDTNEWDKVEKFLIESSPDRAFDVPEGKMHLGISAIDFNVSPARINASGFKIKKAIAKNGRSIRYVPNKAAELSSAQVIHNKLTGQNGWELVIVKDKSKTIIAQTVKVQDIESYSKRDHGRPKRDAKVGMLPPKLAQIIINLSVGKLPDEKLNQTILDPFCGTGVVLQEALLMGYNVYGTDLDQRMIDYSEYNIREWLLNEKPAIKSDITIEIGDATKLKWQDPISFVAGESYLGRPFNNLPDDNTLNEVMSDCNHIIKKFFNNIGSQLEPGTRLCVAVPAWQIRPNQFKHLPLIDQIDALGYNRVSFVSTLTDDLIYYRSGQVVARELLVLIRK
jgi:tRNA G10  N-methylase Trm11